MASEAAGLLDRDRQARVAAVERLHETIVPLAPGLLELTQRVVKRRLDGSRQRAQLISRPRHAGTLELRWPIPIRAKQAASGSTRRSSRRSAGATATSWSRSRPRAARPGP